MAKNVSMKKTNKANNRPNCLKITKKSQKVNLQPITINGERVRLSAREIRTIKKVA